MKISEMTTANFADVVTIAGDSLGNILQNESLMSLFSEDQHVSPVRWAFKMAKVICSSCRDDIFVVLGALCGKTADEIAQQNILHTVAMLRDIYQDIKAAEIPE